MIQKPLHEEQVNEIQKGRVGTCGLAAKQNRGLVTHTVAVAVSVSTQPASHSARGKPNQAAALSRRVGWTIQSNWEGRMSHVWRISRLDQREEGRATAQVRQAAQVHQALEKVTP